MLVYRVRLENITSLVLPKLTQYALMDVDIQEYMHAAIRAMHSYGNGFQELP